jgi:hypothetical protein
VSFDEICLSWLTFFFRFYLERSLVPEQAPPVTVGCQYEVVAPAGKLNIILRTHDEYGVVIEMISEASPLAGMVSVGDQLIGVDELDVREHTAINVSRTIEARQTNVARKLVFLKGDGCFGMEADDDDSMDAAK